MIIDKDIQHLCEHAGVKVSPVRSLILRELGRASAPLSSQELSERLETVDRSTITRALALFGDKGLLHAIEDGSGAVRYELCRSCRNCDGRHDDLHPHFYCVKCHRTVCLSSTPLPDVALPPGFTALEANFIIKGMCPGCAEKYG